jgi:hypothetical protein
MGNYLINFNKSYFLLKNLCDLCVLCGRLNGYILPLSQLNPQLQPELSVMIAHFVFFCQPLILGN